ncbi:MAG TPA: M20/M25/M40 family metallo-hydrolase [Pyrinomonadaceae bacterium]|jgi:hypothetical protein
MKLDFRQSLTSILITLLFLSVPTSLSAQQSGITISTPEQIKSEFDSVPCKNEDRLSAAKALFEKMGAPASDISIDKYKNVENLVIRKPGISQEKIIVGAHYDKVSDGCGAIDNWSGIVAIAHLYRSLKDAPLKKTILFVAFGKEEKGLVGSRAMVDAITKDQVTQYCEMINIDSFGLAAPQVADNMSSKKLSEFTAALAKEMKMPFSHASIEGADSDSSSFIAKKIPALTLHGLSNEWPSILHSQNDQSSRVNPDSVYLGYRLILALVVRLDSLSCGEYR